MAKSAKKAAKKVAKKSPKKAAKKVAAEEQVVESTTTPEKKKPAKKSGGSFATFEEVKELIAATDAEFVKFDNGTKAAGRRIRKNAMAIKKAMGVLRSQISEEVSSM